MILQMSMKESSSSRTLNSLFLILSLNDFFGSSLRELGISFHNRPRSIYQYSNMSPRLSGLTSIFGVVFFVSKSPLGIEEQKKL